MELKMSQLLTTEQEVTLSTDTAKPHPSYREMKDKEQRSQLVKFISREA
jgi:hypothetical protein